MATVNSELRRLFPDGTQPGVEHSCGCPSIDLIPDQIADVFGAAAHLLEASGAFQYIVAPYSACPATAADYGYEAPTFAPTKAEIERWTDLGRRWADDISVQDDIQPFWSAILRDGDAKLVVNPEAKTPAPEWWGACHALLVIADEASREFGYDFASSAGSIRWANRLAGLTLEARTERPAIPSAGHPGDERHLSRHVALDSLGDLLDRNVVRVFPKGRTTEIGCTLRTFSHNLTLLPPHGRANAYWHQPSGISAVSTPDKMNVLLVPFPYLIDAEAFQGCACVTDPPERPWGRFRIDQTWLRPDPDGKAWSTPESRESLIRFVDALIDKSGSLIHGVVFPELALDWDTYDHLVRHIRENRQTIEFMVSGVSSDCNGRRGNQVVTTIFRDRADGPRVAETHSRKKHHRWQLDRAQIVAYGLDHVLDPDVSWWEHLSIEERVLHIDVFREGSIMTAVICEDLARVDPGLALLRSLGPNLVFALLMDGPQTKSRWPGIYATALADDPGSSILSLTCAGMVDRSNAVYKARKPHKTTQRTIGLWRNRADPTRRSAGPDTVEIDLDDDCQAVVLHLCGERAHETTLEGRVNDDTTAWFLEGRRSFGLSAAELDDAGAAWIVRKS